MSVFTLIVCEWDYQPQRLTLKRVFRSTPDTVNDIHLILPYHISASTDVQILTEIKSCYESGHIIYLHMSINSHWKNWLGYQNFPAPSKHKIDTNVQKYAQNELDMESTRLISSYKYLIPNILERISKQMSVINRWRIPEEMRVLLFSYIFENDDEFIRNYCSTSAYTRTEDVRKRLAQFEKLLEIKNRIPQYAVRADHKNDVAKAIFETFGEEVVTAEQIKSFRKRIEERTKGIYDYNIFVRDFFTARNMPNITIREEETEPATGATGFLVSHPEWDMAISVCPYIGPNDEKAKFLPLHMRALSAELPKRDSNRIMRVLLTPFLSDKLQEYMQNPEKPIFGFDAITTIFLESRNKPLTAEQSANWYTLFENISGGLEDFINEWKNNSIFQSKGK